MCRVVETMQADKVPSGHEMMIDLFGEPLGFAAPTHAVKGFEPCAWTIVQVCDRTGNFSLDKARSTCWGVVAGSGVPTHSPEIIQIL